MLTHQTPNAFAFTAKDQSQCCGEIKMPMRVGRAAFDTDDPEAARFQIFDQANQIGHASHGHIFNCARGSLGDGFVQAAARCSGMKTPSTPAPSQLRKIAPRLCGSSMPSSSTTNGRAS